MKGLDDGEDIGPQGGEDVVSTRERRGKHPHSCEEGDGAARGWRLAHSVVEVSDVLLETCIFVVSEIDVAVVAILARELSSTCRK